MSQTLEWMKEQIIVDGRIGRNSAGAIAEIINKAEDKLEQEINQIKYRAYNTGRQEEYDRMMRNQKEVEAETCEWSHVKWHANCLCLCNDNNIMLDYELVSGFKTCPYCSKKIEILEVEQ